MNDDTLFHFVFLNICAQIGSDKDVYQWKVIET